MIPPGTARKAHSDLFRLSESLKWVFLVDVRGAKNEIIAVKWGFRPLNHNKQKCKTLPNNNHVFLKTGDA